MSVYGELFGKGMDALEVAAKRGFRNLVIFAIADAVIILGQAAFIIYLLATR